MYLQPVAEQVLPGNRRQAFIEEMPPPTVQQPQQLEDTVLPGQIDENSAAAGVDNLFTECVNNDTVSDNNATLPPSAAPEAEAVSRWATDVIDAQGCAKRVTDEDDRGVEDVED